MTYRRLLKSELEELEKEFIDFLVVNGIVASDWVKLKQNNIDKANAIIDSFSDVVFESSMRKIKYLDFVTPTSIKCFQCLENEITLVAIEAKSNSKVDFTKLDWKNNLNDLLTYTKTKKYKKKRELELFGMIASGAEISNGELFKNICLLL